MKRVVNNVQEISGRLRQARQLRRLRQTDCARLINISLSHYNKLEQGIGGVSDAVLMAAADVLNVPFEWLCHGTGEMPGVSENGLSTPRHRLTRREVASVVKTVLQPNVQELAEKIAFTLEISRIAALRIVVRRMI